MISDEERENTYLILDKIERKAARKAIWRNFKLKILGLFRKASNCLPKKK
jgi:hypothetical protein